jgi:exonuclease SbcC
MREEEKRTIARLKKQLRDAERWQADLETARAQQQTTADLSAQLATLRERDQSTTEQVGKLRALCESLKGQAEHMKQRKAMITDEATTTCPLCGSHLGTEGVASVLSHYDRDLETMRQQYRQARDEADNLEQDLSRLREEVRQRDAEVEQARRGAARVETLQQQLAGATEAQQELDEAQTKLADVERQLAEQDYERVAREALLTVEAELTELLAEPEPRKGGGWTAAPAALERERKALERQQSSLEKQLATRPDIESEAAARRRELAELEQAAGALPAAEESVAALSSTIERGDFAHEVRQAEQVVEAEMGSLGYSTEGHTAARTRAQELAHWTNEQHRLELARSRQENHQRMLHLHTDALEHCSTELDTLQTEEAQLALDVRALPEATQRAAECGRAAQACSTALRAAQNDQVEKQSWHRRAQEAAQQLAQKQAERQAFAERQGVFQELAEACGKKGVQAMLIETAIPEIEREANRLLGRITNNQMHVTFEMQRSTKKGDQVETLEIKIADSLGTRSYDSFSGGETTRINFAIRIALSRLLAGRAGASLETLVIDEGMSALDADGRERFVEAVTSVQHDFKRILVITHLDELKDRFPARIEVTKTAAGSTWALL